MRRKDMNKICIWILVLAFSVSGCGHNQMQDKNKNIEVENSFGDKEKNKEDIIKVELSQKFINLSGQGVEGLIENIKDGEDDYVDVYENEDGTVTVEITERQRQEYWLPSRGELMEELQEQLKEYDENYRLEHNDSYTQVDAYYNLNLPADKAIVYVIYAEYLCASYQLFSGVDSDDWRVDINIYNSDTGKLVKSGSSDVDFGYEDSDWEASK